MTDISSEECRGDLVSIVIPARNEERNIAKTMASISAQTHRPLEVLLVDGASTDDTVREAGEALSGSDVRLRIIHNEARTIPHALNLGLENARGHVLVRLDAHAEFNTDYVATAVDLLREGCWQGVGGVKAAVATTPFGKSAAMAFARPLGSGGSVYHAGTRRTEVDHIPFGVYHVADLRERGGWDPECLVNQDFELDYRIRSAGGRLLFHPALQITWRGRETPRSLAYQYFRYGQGKGFVVQRHPRSIRPRQILPPLFVASVMFAAAIAAVFRWRAPLQALASAYFGAIAIDIARAARTTATPAEAARLALVYPLMHFPWALGFFKSFVKPVRNDPFRSNPIPVAGDHLSS